MDGLAECDVRQKMACSVIESDLGIGIAKMLADPDLFVMLAQELPPNGIAIFGHDAN